MFDAATVVDRFQRLIKIRGDWEDRPRIERAIHALQAVQEERDEARAMMDAMARRVEALEASRDAMARQVELAQAQADADQKSIVDLQAALADAKAFWGDVVEALQAGQKAGEALANIPGPSHRVAAGEAAAAKTAAALKKIGR